MRTFFLFSALFLSATGFVVAAPAADTAGNSNSDQSVSDMISTTVAQLEPLAQKFGAAIKDSNLDSSNVDSIVSQIDTVISHTFEEVQAAIKSGKLVPTSVHQFLYDLFIGLAKALSVIPVAGPILYTVFSSIATLLYFVVPFGPNHPDSAETLSLISGSLKAIAERSGANLPVAGQ